MTRSRGPVPLGVAALALALAAFLWFALSPVSYGGVEAVAVPEGSPPAPAVRTYASFLEVNGLWGLFVLLVPVGLASLPLFIIQVSGLRYTTAKVLLWPPAIALLGFCVLGIWSVGLFYLPAAIASLAVAVAGTRQRLPLPQ